jgi:hypothetical protein
VKLEFAETLKNTIYVSVSKIICKAYKEFFGEEKTFTPTQYIVFSIISPFLLANMIPGKDLPYVKNVKGVWYIGITNKWILSRTVFAGISSMPAVIHALSDLQKMGLFDVYYESSGNCFNYKYYHLTDLGRGLIQPPNTDVPSSIAAKDDDSSVDKWIPSDDLKSFVKEMYNVCGDGYKYSFVKTDGSPVKYMQNLDKYLQQIKVGTFAADNKQEYPELPKMGIKELANIAGHVTIYSKGTANLADIFIKYNRNKCTSPILAYYNALHPEAIKYNDAHINEALKRNPDFIRQVKEISDTDIHEDNKSILEMLYKVTDYFYDDSVQKSIEQFNKQNHTELNYGMKVVFFKWYLMAYREYRDFYKKWGKEPKYHTIDEWIACTNIRDNWKGSVWWYFIKYVYEIHHVWLVDRQSMADDIKKVVEEQRQRKLGGD